MPRSRNLKHAFFVNEKVAENSPLGRLLFLGISTLADFKGDLEWRPMRIWVQVLPYDECDMRELAINLEKSGLVRFYSDGKQIYLHIVNFKKDQNPHKNEREKGTDIPEYSDELRQLVDIKTLTIKTELIQINREKNGTAPADSLFLTPDSQSLTADAANHDSLNANPAAANERTIHSWTPKQETLAELNNPGSYNVPNQFVREQLAEFITHWSSTARTAKSWDARFMDRCGKQWKKDGGLWRERPAQTAETETAFDRYTSTNWAAGLVQDSDVEKSLLGDRT